MEATDDDAAKTNDVPGGRCYWCGSQDHDGDHCAEAARIFDEHAERWRRADAADAEGGACR